MSGIRDPKRKVVEPVVGEKRSKGEEELTKKVEMVKQEVVVDEVMDESIIAGGYRTQVNCSLFVCFFVLMVFYLFSKIKWFRLFVNHQSHFQDDLEQPSSDCIFCDFKGRIAFHLRISPTCLEKWRKIPYLQMKGSDEVFITKVAVVLGKCPVEKKLRSGNECLLFLRRGK